MPVVQFCLSHACDEKPTCAVRNVMFSQLCYYWRREPWEGPRPRGPCFALTPLRGETNLRSQARDGFIERSVTAP